MNPYTKSVSDWKPMPPSTDNTAKLMNPVARESADNVNASNELKQYEGGKAAGKFGTLGRRGKDF